MSTLHGITTSTESENPLALLSSSLVPSPPIFESLDDAPHFAPGAVSAQALAQLFTSMANTSPSSAVKVGIYDVSGGLVGLLSSNIQIIPNKFGGSWIWNPARRDAKSV